MDTKTYQKDYKKSRNFILSLILMFVLIPTIAYTQTFSGGSGTEFDPYLISTKADLDELADIINNEENNVLSVDGYVDSFAPWSLGKYFEVTNDITEPFTGVIGIAISIYDANYYGDTVLLERVFAGNFDGNGYKIVLDIYKPDDFCVGLFGCCFKSNIKNVVLEGRVVGKSYVGGLVGDAVSSFKDDKNLLYGIHPQITCCYINCDIIATREDESGMGYIAVGGITGSTYICNISYCYVTGSISTTNGCNRNYIGGITGVLNDAYVYNCYVTGNIHSGTNNRIGGIVGDEWNGLLLSNYFAGSISIANNTDTNNRIGAILGSGIDGITGNITRDNNYYIDTWSEQELTNNEYGISKTADQMKSTEFISLLNAPDLPYLGLKFPDSLRISYFIYDSNNVNSGFPVITCPDNYGAINYDISILANMSISPNPTSTDAMINFALIENADITIEISDLSGKIIYSISDFYDAGEHIVALNIKEFSSGSYVCQMLSKGKQIGMNNFIVEK